MATPVTRIWVARWLAKRRYAETQESARRSGIAEYEVLDNHDGELLPTLEVRKQIIRAIRRWNADIVIAPRPNDYHPTIAIPSARAGCAYMVVVRMWLPTRRRLRRIPCSCITPMFSKSRRRSDPTLPFRSIAFMRRRWTF